MRGPGGGYSLARLARNVTVADIIFAVDEPLDATSCGGKRDCTSGNDGKPGKCMTHELWATLNRKMVDYLIRCPCRISWISSVCANCRKPIIRHRPAPCV